MAQSPKDSRDDIASAPESGTVRNETTGNQPSNRAQPGTPTGQDRSNQEQGKDAPGQAQEER